MTKDSWFTILYAHLDSTVSEMLVLIVLGTLNDVDDPLSITSNLSNSELPVYLDCPLCWKLTLRPFV